MTTRDREAAGTKVDTTPLAPRDCGSCCGPADPEVELATFGVAELAELVQRNGAPIALFDANPRDMYLERHIPGARWIRYDAVTPELLPTDKKAMLVFYCTGPKCSASPRAARTAIELGWTNVHVMSDGIFGWIRAGLPIEKG